VAPPESNEAREQDDVWQKNAGDHDYFKRGSLIHELYLKGFTQPEIAQYISFERAKASNPGALSETWWALSEDPEYRISPQAVAQYSLAWRELERWGVRTDPRTFRVAFALCNQKGTKAFRDRLADELPAVESRSRRARFIRLSTDFLTALKAIDSREAKILDGLLSRLEAVNPDSVNAQQIARLKAIVKKWR